MLRENELEKVVHEVNEDKSGIFFCNEQSAKEFGLFRFGLPLFLYAYLALNTTNSSKLSHFY